MVVPTINAVTGGTFGTAEQVIDTIQPIVMTGSHTFSRCVQACMLYSYKNDQASSTYDSFRLRAIASVNSGENEKDVEFADTVVPCMLHPVKPKSANKPAKKDSQ